MATRHIPKWREIEKARNTVFWEKKNRKGSNADNVNVFKIINIHRQECTLHLHMQYMNKWMFNRSGRLVIWAKTKNFCFSDTHTYDHETQYQQDTQNLLKLLSPIPQWTKSYKIYWNIKLIYANIYYLCILIWKNHKENIDILSLSGLFRVYVWNYNLKSQKNV